MVHKTMLGLYEGTTEDNERSLNITRLQPFAYKRKHFLAFFLNSYSFQFSNPSKLKLP